MCGRYTLSPKPQELLRLFGLNHSPELAPRFNIAPTQTTFVVRPGQPSTNSSDPLQSSNELVPMRWGLLPHWASSPPTKPLINARAESIHQKTSFKEAFQKRRCLIPASGFFEWPQKGRNKAPFYIGVAEWKLFTMAGIWEIWRGEDGQLVTSCAIITTRANQLVEDLHPRMPVIVEPKDHQAWLSKGSSPPSLKALLVPYPGERMQAVPVGAYVNSVGNEGPRCIKPAPLQQSLF